MEYYGIPIEDMTEAEQALAKLGCTCNGKFMFVIIGGVLYKEHQLSCPASGGKLIPVSDNNEP